MLEIKGISSQTPILKAQLVQTEENPWSIYQPLFWSCYQKRSFTLSVTVTTGCHEPLHFFVLTFQVNATLLVFSSSLSQNF